MTVVSDLIRKIYIICKFRTKVDVQKKSNYIDIEEIE